MEFRATLPAPCKLNLTLDVGLRRADGYHDIDSIVVQLSPADEVTVHLRPGAGNVRLIAKDKRPDALTDPPLPRGAENLAHAAGRLALDALLPDAPIDAWITLVKRIPVQSGLGAGSSDAATVLKAIGDAAGVGREALLPLAAELGSDVALFLFDGPVRMRGRGEIVEPSSIELPTLHGVVVRPAPGVPTGPAYAALDALPNRTPGDATERLLRQGFSPDALANDFHAIMDGFPAVAGAMEAVRTAGARAVQLCGSGSAVFGLADDATHATALVRQLAGGFPWLKRVESL